MVEGLQCRNIMAQGCGGDGCSPHGLWEAEGREEPEWKDQNQMHSSSPHHTFRTYSDPSRSVLHSSRCLQPIESTTRLTITACKLTCFGVVKFRICFPQILFLGIWGNSRSRNVSIFFFCLLPKEAVNSSLIWNWLWSPSWERHPPYTQREETFLFLRTQRHGEGSEYTGCAKLPEFISIRSYPSSPITVLHNCPLLSKHSRKIHRFIYFSGSSFLKTLCQIKLTLSKCLCFCLVHLPSVKGAQIWIWKCVRKECVSLPSKGMFYPSESFPFLAWPFS